MSALQQWRQVKSDSAIGAFFRRLKVRLGSPKAITATAHKLARIFYQLWTTRASLPRCWSWLLRATVPATQAQALAKTGGIAGI